MPATVFHSEIDTIAFYRNLPHFSATRCAVRYGGGAGVLGNTHEFWETPTHADHKTLIHDADWPFGFSTEADLLNESDSRPESPNKKIKGVWLAIQSLELG